MVEAYLTAQFQLGESLLRPDGPALGAGRAFPDCRSAHYGYARPQLGFEVGAAQLTPAAQASQLRDENDTLGQTVKRYFFAHRLSAQLTRKLQPRAVGNHSALRRGPLVRRPVPQPRHPAAAGQRVRTGRRRQCHARTGSPVAVPAAHDAAAQLAIDDFQYKDRTGPDPDPRPLRLYPAAPSVPCFANIAWRGLYTQASSLAFRPRIRSRTSPTPESGWVAISPTTISFRFSQPRRSPATGWSRPELTLLRQGEGQH